LTRARPVTSFKNLPALAYSEEYFIHIQGEQKGPYTFPQLKQLYEKNLIPEETLYWQDGMEQLQPVAELCGGQRRERLRRLRRLRIGGLIAAGVIALVLAWFAPVLNEGWRELTERNFTAESAYWLARGFVREDVKRQGASVAFEQYQDAAVTLTGTEATVTLPGELFGNDGAGIKKIWRVRMTYDESLREWRLPQR